MNHDKEIFNSSMKHLSQDELVAYCHGKLKHDDLHKVERHLVDCELCSEALQGVEKMDNAVRLAGITHDLFIRSVHKKFRRKNIFSQVQVISLIATLVVLALLIIFSLIFIRH